MLNVAVVFAVFIAFVALRSSFSLSVRFANHLHRMENHMTQKFDDLKASVETYIAASQAAITAAQSDVNDAIAKAVAAKDTAEGVDFDALKAETDAAFAKIAVVPAPQDVNRADPAPTQAPVPADTAPASVDASTTQAPVAALTPADAAAPASA